MFSGGINCSKLLQLFNQYVLEIMTITSQSKLLGLIMRLYTDGLIITKSIKTTFTFWMNNNN